MVTLSLVRAALALPSTEVAAADVSRRAAVAAVLRPGESGLEVLLIRRAEREGDPWSGHMAFPGGRADPDDIDLRMTAVRETREEVGLDLEQHGELLGRLDDLRPGNARGLVPGLVVTPFVWHVPFVPALTPHDAEVDEIHWARLGPLLSGAQDTTYPYTWKGLPMRFPGYRVGDSERIVWGMTHRALETLFTRIASAGPG
jgi:8-oxo-dGTP pyrophosphatase MutT (NUDIX family)